MDGVARGEGEGGLPIKNMEQSALILRSWQRNDRARFRAVTELAQESFIRFGEYREFIGQLMLYDGITTLMLLDPAREPGEDVAGFIMTGIVPHGDSMQGNILAIALSPGYRHRKLGAILMRQGIENIQSAARFQPVETIGLTVAPDNEPAVRLFSRFGFTFVPETEAHYYASGVRACEMTRPLFLPRED